MTKTPSDQYSEQENARRRDAVIKRMIATPPKPHSEMKIGKNKDIPKRNGESRRLKRKKPKSKY